jgi:hypothetical protein
LNERIEDLLDEWRALRGKPLHRGEDLRKRLLQALRDGRELISSKIAQIENEVLE